jgi:acetolactate synthase-1/2/3 large subunit
MEIPKSQDPDYPEYVPDFMGIAASYGAHGIRVTKNEEIIPALKEAKKYKDAPTIVEFLISADELVLPMVKGGNPMSEMILK